MIKESHIFKSQYNNVELRLLQLVEPNNGRLQYTFDFVAEGLKMINDHIGDHSRLISELDEYVLESPDGSYIFLPLTSEFLVYEAEKKKFLSLPINSVAPNNSFKINHFINKKLILVFTREVIVFDLETHQAVSASFPFGLYQFQSAILKNEKLQITFKDLKDYQIYTKEYCFDKMNFLK